MEVYLTYTNAMSGISLALLMAAIYVMFKIYPNMNGKTYGTIWWSSLFFLLVFTSSDAIMMYFVWSKHLVQVEQIVSVAMMCSSFFTLTVVYAGYLTTNDLKAINISKSYLDKIMHAMTSYLVVTDNKFRIKKVNLAICKELGVDKKDLIGSDIHSIFKNSNLTDLVVNRDEQIEAFIQNKDGDKKSVVLTGEPIYRRQNQVHGYVFQAFIDHQKQIRQMDSFFETILNNTDFGIITTDTSGVITRMNPAVEKYFGFRENEIVNRFSPDLFHYKDDPDKFMYENNVNYDGDNSSMFNDDQPISREMMMVRRDGTTFPALITINAIKNDGKTIGYFEIIADISDKKKAEEELRKANADLKDFAHVVSHDLKAPLRAIGTLASWLKDDYAEVLDEEGREQLTILMGRVSRMEGLINGILEYSKVGRTLLVQHKMEDLNEIIEEVADAVIPADRFNLIVDTPLPSISIDRTRAHQIFQNIISNSVKYMDKEVGEIRIACHREEGFWNFSVADNGPGIEKQYFDKIFQIFQTLKPRDEYESTGVGLAIVKKSVELYGGQVWLDSNLDTGTTFYFTIPEN